MNTKRGDDGDAGVRRIVTRYSSWPERRGAQTGGRVGGGEVATRRRPARRRAQEVEQQESSSSARYITSQSKWRRLGGAGREERARSAHLPDAHTKFGDCICNCVHVVAVTGGKAAAARPARPTVSAAVAVGPSLAGSVLIADIRLR